MRNVFKVGFLLFIGLAPVAKATPQADAPAKINSSGASEKTLGEAYSILAVDKLYAPTPSDKAQILSAIAKLKGLAHPIAGKANGPRMNPALGFLLFSPQQTLPRLEQAFQRGSYAQAGYGLRHAIQLCAECHANAPKPNWHMLQATAGLSLIELADFYKFAGRPNDALLYYEKILTTKGTAASRPDIWERAALNIVGLGIETAGSPYTYVDVLSNLLQETTISKKQRELVSSWRAQGKNWGLEKNLPSKPAELLDHARMLIQTGDKNNRIMPNSGLVQYSRAMYELKRVSFSGSAEQKTKAFLEAGELREKIALSGIWLNSEDYYEACIRATPRSSEGGRCWNLLSTLSQRDSKFNLEAETHQQLQALLR